MQASPRRRSDSKQLETRDERRKKNLDSLDALAAGIRSLRILQQRFLNGDLPAPPVEDAKRLQQDMRRIREAVRDARSRFRLDSLQGQLQAMQVLFDRRLDARERGRDARRVVEATPLDATAGVVIGGADDTRAEQALYRQLTKDPRAAARLDEHRFHAMLEKHVATIRAKTGCQEIRFRVELEDGKPKLKARPIKAST